MHHRPQGWYIHLTKTAYGTQSSGHALIFTCRKVYLEALPTLIASMSLCIYTRLTNPNHTDSRGPSQPVMLAKLKSLFQNVFRTQVHIRAHNEGGRRELADIDERLLTELQTAGLGGPKCNLLTIFVHRADESDDRARLARTQSARPSVTVQDFAQTLERKSRIVSVGGR